MSLHKKGNKPGAVHVRYRSVNRFFKWAVKEEERQDNPIDFIDPPNIPQTIQHFYEPAEIERVMKVIGKDSIYALRDRAIVLTLYDCGVRASELCGMRIDELNLDRAPYEVKVVGKAGKERFVGIGSKPALAIDRYLRRRQSDSPWL